jgi:phosphoglycolate phosphatase
MNTPVIFDLDGTLVDSAEGILSAFAAAFAATGLAQQRALDISIIGPPLQQTLEILSGSKDPKLLSKLSEAFKTHYDGQGFKLTRVYTGVEELLAGLAGTQLFIATNKRHLPTQRLMDFFGWRRHFQAILSLDTLQPPAPNKAALIRHLRECYQLPSQTLYVGDRSEDGEAAAAAGLPFFHATWGYGAAALMGAVGHGDIAALNAYIRRDSCPQ